ncbi:hypothetical protein XBJ1_1226 [Xenorhabdus bovienii SS-2004]|uniref:Uncharacterized protein n=1 Tax=Xenorhabdus bovienii (strain SS-2004) TaxID=406818 RepID=D3UXI4_XENBS|nr:hypothetical protein XBJ1_1226 [Xenorhabdus bovienii SS-2004]
MDNTDLKNNQGDQKPKRHPQSLGSEMLRKISRRFPHISQEVSTPRQVQTERIRWPTEGFPPPVRL